MLYFEPNNLTMKEVLIINAHQKYDGISEGKLNKTLAQQAKSFFREHDIRVSETIIDQGYDVDEEVEKHLLSDLIVLQTPINWANLPWSYKKYADEVFNKGLFSGRMAANDGRTLSDPTRQYGSGGLMNGKAICISATWNAPQECFEDSEQKWMGGKSADDVLLNVVLNYKFFGYEILAGYHCFDVLKNPKPELYFERYATYLKNIIQISKTVK
jgi:modulator of drug activity B